MCFNNTNVATYIYVANVNVLFTMICCAHYVKYYIMIYVRTQYDAHHEQTLLVVM